MGVVFGARSVSGEGPPEPVFREPWEAQAFAMTVLLHERGLFTWGEWAQALGAQIASAAGPRTAACDPAAEKSYYQHWLAALESLVAAKGVSSADELTRYQRAWEHAAHRTPHGQSIDLQPQDLGG
ncbi:MAG: nitrile hydratase accessory protein [Proteobacteria bacterium]|nr:nitrile hydratase accessory protein [Pseudomonadota bacterium]